LPGQIAGQHKGNQGQQDENSRGVKKPIVVQMIPGRTRWIAITMPFMGMMMMFAHAGSTIDLL